MGDFGPFELFLPETALESKMSDFGGKVALWWKDQILSNFPVVSECVSWAMTDMMNEFHVKTLNVQCNRIG